MIEAWACLNNYNSQVGQCPMLMKWLIKYKAESSNTKNFKLSCFKLDNIILVWIKIPQYWGLISKFKNYWATILLWSNREIQNYANLHIILPSLSQNLCLQGTDLLWIFRRNRRNFSKCASLHHPHQACLHALCYPLNSNSANFWSAEQRH